MNVLKKIAVIAATAALVGSVGAVSPGEAQQQSGAAPASKANMNKSATRQADNFRGRAALACADERRVAKEMVDDSNTLLS